MSKIKVQNIEPKQEEQPENPESSEDTEMPEPVTRKQPPKKMIICPNCNKEMLNKTYKYYNSLKCKPKEEEEPIPQPPRPEKIEVSFNVGRRVAQNEKIKRLISQAF
jgi:hypothetical protein